MKKTGCTAAADKWHLNAYLPLGAFYVLLPLLSEEVAIRVVPARKTLLGSYCYHFKHKSHIITINKDLNCYAFLVTLLHEWAHYETFKRCGNRARAHGPEWQAGFKALLRLFSGRDIFPEALERYFSAPDFKVCATTCADRRLYELLRFYDKSPQGVRIEEIAVGSFFELDGRRFKLIEKLRKRYKAQELSTRRYYLLAPFCSVRPGV